ncbi:MAG: arginine--tRNA ligase, partial [Gemmatimonadetes bacterium]|nr:arginine--tRNA ligase [Gemmatimonadota bacterium]
MVNPFVEEIVLQVSKATEMSCGDVRALIETPPKPEMGDYALPCFALAKIFRKAPHLIAEELSAQIATGDRISEVRPAGPYLNFFVPKTNLAGETLSAILEQGADYGRGDHGAGKTVVIDFSHPN